jgi:uncharacterized protein YbjT (DUF2867 family)
MTLAVTGSTGALGRMVADLLVADGVPLRLIVRDSSRAPALPGTEVRQATYGDPEASIAALAGVDVLFMVSAAESETRLDEHRTFVAAARAAGVEHIVYTSFAGAAADSIFTLGRDHFATEEAIRGSGVAYTFLRDNFYIDFMELLAGEDGVIRGPAGDGRLAAVARADIARVAALVLRDPAAHAGETYNMTGPEALTLSEVAQAVSDIRGGSMTFHNETISEAYASRAPWGAPAWQVDAWVSTYTSIASGEVAEVSDDIRRLTGVAPMSLREFLAG